MNGRAFRRQMETALCMECGTETPAYPVWEWARSLEHHERIGDPDAEPMAEAFYRLVRIDRLGPRDRVAFCRCGFWCCWFDQQPGQGAA